MSLHMLAAQSHGPHTAQSQACEDSKHIQQKLLIPGHGFDWLVQVSITFGPCSVLYQACSQTFRKQHQAGNVGLLLGNSGWNNMLKLSQLLSKQLIPVPP